ncbi:hypothetical protein D3C80_1889470 [compost metagenome]
MEYRQAAGKTAGRSVAGEDDAAAGRRFTCFFHAAWSRRTGRNEAELFTCSFHERSGGIPVQRVLYGAAGHGGAAPAERRRAVSFLCAKSNVIRVPHADECRPGQPQEPAVP